MKLKHQTRFTFAALGVLLALVFQVIVLPVGKNIPVANAESATEITLTNGSFNSSPSSYYLDSTPNGWSKINASSPSTSGVINTNDDKFSSYTQTYRLTTNPQTMYVDVLDTKIMMINARNENGDTGAYSQGYRSGTLALSAYSYYSISILVKTEIGATASVYLDGFEDDIDTTVNTELTKFEMVQTTSWKEYKFYVETGADEQNITIAIYLGSKLAESANAVFFDNITVFKLSQKRFEAEQTNTETIKTIEYVKVYLKSVTNSDFETGDMNGWQAIDQFPTDSIHRVINTTQSQIMTSEGYTYLNGDNVSGSNALWLASKGTHSEFGVSSTTLDVERFGIYKITVNAKVDEETVAKIAVVEDDIVKEFFENAGIDEAVYKYEPVTTSLTISSNKTNDIMNNYNTYEFYIKGHPLFDTTVHIELSLIKQVETDTQVSGSAMFDNITLQQISNKTFEGVEESTLTKKATLTTVSEETTISNGTFNSSASTKTNNTFPIAPANWTSQTTNELQNVYGIVNTNQIHYDANKANYGNISNPGNPSGFSQDLANETNNILMLWNKTDSYQSIESEKFSVTADSFCALTFSYRNMQGANLNVSVYTQDDVKVFEQEYLPFTTWTNYTLTINVSSSVSQLKVKFSFGTASEKAVGFAFIDNVDLTQLTEMTADDFATKVDEQNSINKTLDLSSLLWNTRLLQNNDNSYELAAFSQSLDSGSQAPNSDPIANAGVIDGQSNSYSVLSTQENTNKIKNIYFIQTHGEATYSITSKNSISLTSGTIYKFTVSMRTRLSTVGEDYVTDYGAKFSLIGVDGTIENIITNDKWQEITIIVNTTTTADVELKFSLTSQNQTTGLLFVDNYTFDTLTTEEYSTYVEQFEDETVENDNLLIVGSTDIEEEQTEEEETETADFNWLILPSLLFAVALIFAIVGTVLRRVSFKKWTRKKASEYDRKKTLYRDVIRKQAEEKRDEEIKEQNTTLALLQTELDEMEKENQERLNNQRREKGKKIDKEVEKQFKAYASKHTKLQNKKDAIIEKIKQLNSAEYLLSLQKKIQIEQLKKLQTPETKKPEKTK